MKTTVNRHRVGTSEEFADEFGLEMVVDETNAPADSDNRYRARFMNCRCRVLIFNINADFNYGDGNTPEAATEDLAKRITCQTLTVYSDESYSSDTKQIPVWRLDEKPAEKAEGPENDFPPVSPCGCGAKAHVTRNGKVYRVSCSDTTCGAGGAYRDKPSEAVISWNNRGLEPQPQADAPCPVCGSAPTDAIYADGSEYIRCGSGEHCVHAPVCKTEIEGYAAWNKLAGRE